MEKSIGRMINVVYRKSLSYLSLALGKHNLTAAEQPVFAAMQKYDGTTQDELSSLLSIDKAAIARTVKSLEEKGFVKRVQDKQDRRQNRINLTETGRQCWPDIKNELLHYNELLMQNIDPDSQDIIYNALLIMEENTINMAKNKIDVTGREGD